MQISNRTKIITGAVAATIVLGAAGIGAAYAAGDGDGDGDNDGSPGQGTVQTPLRNPSGFRLAQPTSRARLQPEHPAGWAASNPAFAATTRRGHD